MELSYIEHLFLRHRDPDCLLLSRVGYNVGTIVTYHHFLHVIHSLINYIRIFNTEETESAFRNAFYTSVSLVVSTFIYGRTSTDLSLVDGLIVTFLPFLITIGATYNSAIILRGKVTLKVAYIMHLSAIVAFGLTVWKHVDTYGTSPGCNLNSSVKVVVFGHSVAATNRGLRKFSIFVFVINAICIPPNALALIPTGSDLDSGSNPNLTLYLDWIIFFVWPLMFSTWVYCIVTVEQIIRRNGFSHATSQWTYSQTFAVVLMLGPVIDLVSALGRLMRGGKKDLCSRCSTKYPTSRAGQESNNREMTSASLTF